MKDVLCLITRSDCTGEYLIFLFISLIINKKTKTINQLSIVSPGVLEEHLDHDILSSIKSNILKAFNTLSFLDESKLKHTIQFSVQKHIKKLLNKSPLVTTNIFVV